RHTTQSDTYVQLAVGAGQTSCRFYSSSTGDAERNHRSRDGGPLRIIDLNHEQLIDRSAGDRDLLAAADFHEGSTECLRFYLSGGYALLSATRYLSEYEQRHIKASHFFVPF